MSKKLLINEVQDPQLRENFRRIQEFMDTEHHLAGFVFFSATFDGPIDGGKIYHGLGFIPKDVLRTRVTGTGLLTFNHDDFDENYMDVTTTDACEIRGFVGSYLRSDE